ncbi:nucleoside diphosphate kinase 7-like [Centruroides sculpturatus]|uniref:nucleoside diphosphate kinase 7-like n=1 Tax=Centruroides sculpturatus TaxID=218467 RepID=UPI000C6C8F2E|nr:nucleoside diphosphate kinase 7-like [Centruroides sculpturatus]
MEDKEDKYIFIAEWYDNISGLLRKFYFTFFTIDETIEMYDMINKRLFLRRTPCSTVRQSDIYLGSILNVMSRQIKLVDYANLATRQKLDTAIERTFGLLKFPALQKLGYIMDIIYRNDLTISNARMLYLSENESRVLLKENEKEIQYRSCTCVPAPLHCSPQERDLRGRERGTVLEEKNRPKQNLNPNSSLLCGHIASYATQSILSSFPEPIILDEIEIFFPEAKTIHCTTAKFTNCTCCIIKPHIVRKEKKVPIYIDYSSAEDFYEVYKGVVAEYSEMVKQLSEGPCIALEISSPVCEESMVTKLRQFVGPSDPEIAQHLRPTTLRARFGESSAKNAVHCTDLPQDGLLEVEFIFKILARI